MKRVLAGVLLAALALTFCASVAGAGVSYKYNHETLTWNTTTRDSASGVYLRHAIITSGYINFPAPYVTTPADSIPIVVVLETSAAGAATDTLYTTIEVSYDGVNFTTDTAFPAANQLGNVGAGRSCILRLYPNTGALATWVCDAGYPVNTCRIPKLNGARSIRVKVYGSAASWTNNAKVMGQVFYPVIE